MSNISTPNKKIPISYKLCFWFFGIIIFVTWFGSLQIKTPVEKPKTAIELAAEKLSTEQENLTLNLYATVRQNLRDPSYIEVIDLRASNDGKIACLKYRARNGFGGMIVETAVTKRGNVDTNTSAWNKNCTKAMRDMNWYVNNAETIYKMTFKP